jgi:hypothetical protein
LTQLVDLRLENVEDGNITASMLSGMLLLTRLDLSCGVTLEPYALAGKTRLQHLYSDLDCQDAEDLEQLLSHLQHMQQLTHLYLDNMWVVTDDIPPAEAYSALTASSKLRYLDISAFGLPAGAWQHVFPAGRWLPHLRSLSIGVVHFAEDPPRNLDGACLVSCCPGLQSLCLGNVQPVHKGLLLGPLKELSWLQRLQLDDSECTKKCLEALSQLRGLQSLIAIIPSTLEKEGLMLQMTKLKQLTTLNQLRKEVGGKPHRSQAVTHMTVFVLLLTNGLTPLQALGFAFLQSAFPMAQHIT